MSDTKKPSDILIFPDQKTKTREEKEENFRDFVVNFLEEYGMVYGLVMKVMGDKIRQNSDVENELLKILKMDKKNLYSMIEKYMNDQTDINQNSISDSDIEEFRTKILMMYDIYHKIGIYSQSEIDRLNMLVSNVTVITPGRKPKLDK